MSYEALSTYIRRETSIFLQVCVVQRNAAGRQTIDGQVAREEKLCVYLGAIES